MIALVLFLLPGVVAPQDREPGELTWIEERVLRSSDGREVLASKGRLVVLENRSEPDGNRIELAFVHLASLADEPGPPLVYLAGGPGQAAIPRARSVDAWMGMLDVGDVVFLDQRGIGESRPNLGFQPEGGDATRFFLDESSALEFMLAGLQQGREHFEAQGVDLAAYNTAESADDLDDLRLALGAERLNLLGFSYGTHLAQAAIRRHAEHLANVVICGVEGLAHTYKLPSTMDTAFRKLALLAAQDPTVAQEVPDLEALLDEVLAKLADEPMVVEVFDERLGRDVEVPVGPFGLSFVLRRDIGDRSDLVVFPRLLHSILAGDPRLLQWFVRKRYPGDGTSMMTWMCDGASGASATRLARIRAEAARSPFGNVVNFPFPQAAEALAIPDLGEDFRRPLVSDVRTLFLTGTLDFNTPPYQAEEVRWGFTNATHLIVENAGHEQVLPQPEIQAAIVRFLRGEDVRDVHVALPPLRFVPIPAAGGEPAAAGTEPLPTHPAVPDGR